MLVLNGDRPGLKGPEQAAISALRTSGIPGIALSGCHTHGGETDLLIFTPAATLAVEVKGLLLAQPDTTLYTPPNSRWHATGIDGDPVHVRGGDTNPWDQAKDKVFGAKKSLEPAVGPLWVGGLVLVVPYPGAHLEIPALKGPTPWGIPVLGLNRPTDLREWLDTWLGKIHARHGAQWTIARVLLALDTLGAAPEIDADTLAAEGFPSAAGEPAPVPERDEPAPPASAPLYGIGQAATHIGHATPGTRRPPMGRGAARPYPRAARRPRRRHSWRGLITPALLAGIAVAVLTAALVLGDIRSASTPEPAGPQTSGPVPTSETVVPPPPVAPAPPSRSSCYPFDAAC